MSLVRVFEIPADLRTNGYLFDAGKPFTFNQVDWFQDARDKLAQFLSSQKPRTEAEMDEELISVIKEKRYYRSDRRYLILRGVRPLLINYKE